jgi:hypothetical protein
MTVLPAVMAVVTAASALANRAYWAHAGGRRKRTGDLRTRPGMLEVNR